MDEDHSYSPKFIPIHTIKGWKEKKKLLPKKDKSKKQHIHSIESLQKYNVTLPAIKASKDLKKEKLLLPFRRFIDKRENDLRKALEQIPLKDRYKLRATDIYLRTLVMAPENEVRTILDTDEKFFSVVDGRPLVHHAPMFKSVKEIYNKTLMLKQVAGYRKDNTLSIDTNLRIEHKQYETCNDICLEQIKYFDHFISEDYSKSMHMLKEWEDIKFRLHMKSVEYRHLAAETYSIRSRIVTSNDRYTLQKKYQRFLSFLSPDRWRIQNHITNFDFGSCDIGTDDNDDSFSMIFDQIQLEFSRGSHAAALYFTGAEHMMEVYRFVENQNFNYFRHVTRASILARELHDKARALEAAIIHEYSQVEGVINDFNELIGFTKSRWKYLEERFNHILNGPFYDWVASSEILMLTTSLEYCFERVFGEPPCNMSLYSMAVYLEDLCFKYLNKVDILSNDLIKVAVRENIESDNRMMKQAVKASRELKCFDILSKRLLKAAEPPAVSCRTPSFRSKAEKVKLRSRKKIAVKCLTREQVDYLTMFTEWVIDEDPAPYLASKDAKELINL